jgi:cysteine desulfurase
MTDNAPRSLYLDSAASTAVRPEVLEAMLPYFTSLYANPSGHHAGGFRANDAIGAAAHRRLRAWRAQEEVIFTSGGARASTRR